MTDTDSQNPTRFPDAEPFVRLLMANERRIYGYILALVGNVNDADDLMQETSAILWKKFDHFEANTSFPAWAMKIAHFEILKFIEGRGGAASGRLDAEVLDSLSEIAAEVVEEADDRFEALETCLAKLPQSDREMIRMRYEEQVSAKNIASRIDRSSSAVHKALTRVHRRLLECIERTMRTNDL